MSSIESKLFFHGPNDGKDRGSQVSEGEDVIDQGDHLDQVFAEIAEMGGDSAILNKISDSDRLTE